MAMILSGALRKQLNEQFDMCFNVFFNTRNIAEQRVWRREAAISFLSPRYVSERAISHIWQAPRGLNIFQHGRESRPSSTAAIFLVN